LAEAPCVAWEIFRVPVGSEWASPPVVETGGRSLYWAPRADANTQTHIISRHDITIYGIEYGTTGDHLYARR